VTHQQTKSEKNDVDFIDELRIMRANWFALARGWELQPHEVSLLLPERGEDTPSPPRDTEHRMRLMLAISHRLPFGARGDEYRAWPRTPLFEFGGLTPLDIMSEGTAQMAALSRYAGWKYGR